MQAIKHSTVQFWKIKYATTSVISWLLVSWTLWLPCQVNGCSLCVTAATIAQLNGWWSAWAWEPDNCESGYVICLLLSEKQLVHVPSHNISPFSRFFWTAAGLTASWWLDWRLPDGSTCSSWPSELIGRDLIVDCSSVALLWGLGALLWVASIPGLWWDEGEWVSLFSLLLFALILRSCLFFPRSEPN